VSDETTLNSIFLAADRNSPDVQSLHEVDRIDPESFKFGCPLFADELIERQTFQGLEPVTEVVGVDEVAQVLPELRVIIVVAALDHGFLENPVHPLDLPVGARIFDLGRAMLDAMRLAYPTEDVLKTYRSELRLVS